MRTNAAWFVIWFGTMKPNQPPGRLRASADIMMLMKKIRDAVAMNLDGFFARQNDEGGLDLMAISDRVNS